MRTTGFQRTALRGAILIFWFACVWTPDLFGQGLTIPTPSPLPDGVTGTAIFSNSDGYRRDSPYLHVDPR